MSTKDMLLVGALAAAAFFFYKQSEEKKAKDKATVAAVAAGAPIPAGFQLPTSETQDVLAGVGTIITATGDAIANVFPI